MTDEVRRRVLQGAAIAGAAAAMGSAAAQVSSDQALAAERQPMQGRWCHHDDDIHANQTKREGVYHLHALGEAIEAGGKHGNELKAKQCLAAWDDEAGFGEQLLDFGLQGSR